MHTLWELIDWTGTNVSQSDSYRRIGEELVRLGKMRVHVDISGVVPNVLSRHDSTRNGFECAWYTPTYFLNFVVLGWQQLSVQKLLCFRIT